MAKLPRITIPGVPHHIIQRGNRRQRTFFSDDDYQAFLKLFQASFEVHRVEVWVYALMPNHTHTIALPHEKDSLSGAMAETYENYARLINARNNWRGHLWQERFKSMPMDEKHLHEAMRYVELNPVRAGLCTNPFEYKWSTANIHLKKEEHSWIKTRPIIERIDDWESYLSQPMDRELMEKIRKNTNTGRPLGSDEFLAELERMTGRILKKQKPGPKPKNDPK